MTARHISVVLVTDARVRRAISVLIQLDLGWEVIGAAHISDMAEIKVGCRASVIVADDAGAGAVAAAFPKVPLLRLREVQSPHGQIDAHKLISGLDHSALALVRRAG